MASLDVEAVDSLDVDAPDYVLYGGKGGVGKTTMAAATALASARDGTRTLVVSTDPAHSLSDTFETDVPAEPTRIREDAPLFAAEIDPDAAMEQTDVFGGEDGDGGPTGGLGDVMGGMGGLGDLLGGEDSPLSDTGGPMPGSDEAAAMQQLLAYMDDDRFERVVIDTAPTGHTLRLLELPELMDSMLGKLVAFRQRIQGMVEGVKGTFGGGDPEAGMADLEELRERIERLRRTLRDPSRTDFRIVMVPEEMSVFESKRLRARLEEFGIPVGTVVVNKVMEDLAAVAPDVDPETIVSPNLDTCEFCKRRWQVQQAALSEAQELFRGSDVKRVPLLAEEVRGERLLAVVAACLA